MGNLRSRLVFPSVAALAVLGAVLVWRLHFPGRDFDPVRWRDLSPASARARQGRADRLLARRTLVDKTRAQVVELLGEPPPTGYFSDWDLAWSLFR